MAIGKNKKFARWNRDNKSKKKSLERFARKEWYTVRAPPNFKNRRIGQTLVNRSTKSFAASKSLIGREFSINLGDLQGAGSEDMNVALQCRDVVGRECITEFKGLEIARSRLQNAVRKWQTTIEANVEIKTTDGYKLRVFVYAFTQRRLSQLSMNSYCTSRQEKAIRKEMRAAIKKETEGCSLSKLTDVLVCQAIPMALKKACYSFHNGEKTFGVPVYNTLISKVKMLKQQDFDRAQYLKHEGLTAADFNQLYVEDTGVPVQ